MTARSSRPTAEATPIRRPAGGKRAPTAPAADSNSPPAHLSPASAAWWSGVLADYDLEAHHVHLLTLAAEAWDRAEQARSLLAVEGITYVNRFGDPVKHPAVSVEENSRIAFARLVRELDLDAEVLPAPRPPRRGRH
jgi:phage terminase small subunit